MIKILAVDEINGKRVPVDYNYRKTEFPSHEEMEKYKNYLEGVVKKQLLITYKDYGNS